MSCRTARLGKTVYKCQTCPHEHFIYRSCKNRFCPTCGINETFKWADASLSKLLNIKHHHVIFTLPKPLRHISKLNGDLIHNLLFKLANETLANWFEHKHNLRPGIVAVLHTAGSDLKYHPHVHLIVTGGGQHLANNSIVTLKHDYLTKQRFLANQFRKLFINEICALFKKDKLIIPKSIDHSNLKNWISRLKQKQWIVSIQKPLNDIKQIIGYVGRYSKRTCISEYKITNLSRTHVSFAFNDYKNTPRGHKPLQSIITLTITQFLDNLLQHVPNKKYRMVRYFGIYSSFYLAKLKIQQGVNLDLNIKIDEQWSEFPHLRKNDVANGKPDPLKCPNCKTIMAFSEIVYPFKITHHDT